MAIGIVFRFVIAVDALGNPVKKEPPITEAVGSTYLQRSQLGKALFPEIEVIWSGRDEIRTTGEKLPVDVESRISSHLAGIIENAPYSIKWALCGCWSIYPRPFFDGYPPNRHAAMQPNPIRQEHQKE
jgi:hypothetical protein